MELYYINSKNEVLDFTKFPYQIQDLEELLDYSWDYEVTDQKVIKYYRGVCEIPLTLNVSADTESEYNEACNRLHEVIEIDTMNFKKGRLYYNGQFISCNIISSQKKDWCKSILFNKNYIRVITDKPYWITEKKFEFLRQSDNTLMTSGLDFPIEFPFDFTPEPGVEYLVNDHFTSSRFKMIVYGPCQNPRITINNHIYEVVVPVYDNEYLEIASIDIEGRGDKKDRFIEKHTHDGEIVSCWNNRNKESEIFASIPAGKNVIERNGDFGVDIILYIERSEPKWI